MQQTCNAKYCLLYQVDKDAGIDNSTDCDSCHEEVHLLCEGKSSVFGHRLSEQETYTCSTCSNLTVDEIVTQFESTVNELKVLESKKSTEIHAFHARMENLEHKIDKGIGKRQKLLYDGLKTIGTQEQAFHGGDLNGKDTEKVFEYCLRNPNIDLNLIVKCIADRDPQTADRYLQMFKILADIWNKLRHPPASGPCGEFSDQELEEIQFHCQRWGEMLPILFPDRNITRKGHLLSIHLPETLKKLRTFYMFYKTEQAGEKIHSQFNKLMTRWKSRRPKDARLFGMIQAFEISQKMNTGILEPMKRKQP